jgi:hypothetical protein
MKTPPALNKMRFVSCMNGIRLLITSLEVAARATGGGALLNFPAGSRSAGDFTSTPMNKINLTRREICRGKISRWKNKTNRTNPEERTQPAPNQ